MAGLLVAGIAGGGPKTASPRRLADRGLVEELFQALVGAVCPDDDYYDNATLNGSASHAGHAITRVFSTQGEQTRASALRIPWRLTNQAEKRKHASEAN
jgi:hypothetical protein